MTTPAQWLDILADGAASRPARVTLTESDIARIQVDALMHAVQSFEGWSTQRACHPDERFGDPEVQLGHGLGLLQAATILRNEARKLDPTIPDVFGIKHEPTSAP